MNEHRYPDRNLHLSAKLCCRHLLLFFLVSILFTTVVFAQERLFVQVGAPEFARLPDHVSAAQQITINRRALQSSAMIIDLFGDEFIAVRDKVERRKAGQLVWIGHLQNNPQDSVIITLRGVSISGMIQQGAKMYRISLGVDKGHRLLEVDLESLPPDDTGPLPDGGGATLTTDSSTFYTVVPDAVTQDLLVVYNQGACDKNGGCSQLEADIVTAVADINAAYAESGITINMNLVGTALTDYVPDTSLQALSDLRGTTDGYMDEVHPLRDQLGADLVALVYDGPGCGIGYLKASASSAFTVTAVECLVGNRSMAHEIGHNQGAHHDRQTVGTTSTGDYNYGFRRCNDGSVDDLGSPYFRTVLSYPCTSSPRVGRFSSPEVLYQGVPQGVDPVVDPERGAWNSKVLNERAAMVAGFRTAAAQTVPAAPTDLQAVAARYDTIDVIWKDNADNEDNYTLQSSLDNITWGTIATLAADTTSFQHNGLLPETTHYYRARAENSIGISAFSNTAFTVTPALPTTIEDLARGERLDNGMITGSFTDTHKRDMVVEAISEQSTGGPKRSRKQFYIHTWNFDVLGGDGGVVFSIDARVSGSEGADFYYSTDNGITFNYMFTVDNVVSTEMRTFALPEGTSGPLLIRVQDNESQQGEPQDSLFVDYMVVTSYTKTGTPPATPTNMTVTDITSTEVALRFTDNADDEFGFEILRSGVSPAGDCNAGIVAATLGANSDVGTVLYIDRGLAADAEYWYWARSFNGAGDNGACSNAVQARTLPAASIALAGTAQKIKGVVYVDLVWDGVTGSMVDIVRDGRVVDTVANNGNYTDNTGAKGGGSYSYKVCEAGSTIACSPDVIVIY